MAKNKEEKEASHLVRKTAWKANQAASASSINDELKHPFSVSPSKIAKSQVQRENFATSKEYRAAMKAAYGAAKKRLREKQQAAEAAKEAALLAENIQKAANSTKLPENNKDIADFIFEENLFDKILGSINYNREVVYTNFTDEQAVAICAKIASSYARSIALKYSLYQNHIQGSVLRYQIHLLANKALNLYGGPLLTFLYKLRPLHFKTKEIFSVKYIQDNELAKYNPVYFPALTFRTTKTNQFTLAFHLNKNISSKKNRNPIQIFKNGRHIGSISKRGNTFDPHGNRLKASYDVKPTLLIFCDFLKKSKSPAFYSGVETGSCFICGRTLTDPDSILYGIGPVCLGRV